MKKYLSVIISFALILLSPIMNAQPADVEMAEGIRTNGMIYIVVLVVLVILTGIILYLISMDRKLSRLEKEVDK